jgi:hypothetical protein
MENMRMGRIEVSDVNIHDEVIAKVLADLNFVPFDVTYHHDTGRFVMLGTSTRFNTISRGSVAPQYNLVIHCDGEGEYTKTDVIRKT